MCQKLPLSAFLSFLGPLQAIKHHVTGLGVDLTGLDEDVGFLFDEQVIQDERLLNLETETEEVDEQLVTKLKVSFLK